MRIASGFCIALIVSTSACNTMGSASDGSDVDALPAYALEEELRIGDVDDPDLGFSQIGQVDVDRDGNVYVVERVDMQIRVFDRNGRPLRRIGRRGEGPGEFANLSTFGVVGDTVWASDSRLRRITLFDREGNIIGEVTAAGAPIETSSPGFTVTIRPYAMRADGLFTSSPSLGFGGGTPPAGGPPVRAPRLLFNASGEVVDTLGWWEIEVPDFTVRREPREMIKAGDREIRRPEPPVDTPLRMDIDGDSVVIDRTRAVNADDAHFTITRTSATGDTVYHRRYTYRPRPYEGAALDTIVAGMARGGGSGGRGGAVAIGGAGVMIVAAGAPTSPEPTSPEELRVMERAIRDALVMPPHQPPVTLQRSGRDEGVWLRREEDGAANHRWLMLDPDGRPVGELVAPRGLTFAWSSGDEVWAIDRDELDVPWLVRYRLVRQ